MNGLLSSLITAFDDCIWRPFINCLPFDDSPILQIIVAVAITLGVAWLWWKALAWCYSGPNIAPVTQPVRKPVAIAGAIFGVLSLLELFRHENVAMVSNIAFATGGAILMVWGIARTSALHCSVLRKLLIFVSFVCFVLQAFLLGVLVSAASAMVVAFVFALYFALVAAGESFKQSSGGECETPASPDRKELEDGTVIEKGWGDWVDVNDRDKHYKENLGGTFSRTS